jgi:two-component system, NarL family, sensor histidine kinase DegS
VTESLLSSEMLVKIIDGSPIASFVINHRHEVTHWNLAIEALTGIKRADIIGTVDQWKAFYAEQRPVMADLIVDGASAAQVEAFYSGKCRKSNLIKGAYEAEDSFPELGTDKKWLHFTASPIRGENGHIIGAIETLEDITERKAAEDNLHYYLREITRAQEAERKRIARELHDDTAQVLGSLSRQLDNFIRGKPGLSPKEILTLKDLQVQLNDGVQRVHRFSQTLRLSVLDDLGLVPALRSLARGLEDADGMAVELRVEGTERRFSPEVESMLFRIVQEALNNARKHARASRAEVVVKFGQGQLGLTISDNGGGFQLPGRLDDFTRLGKLGLAGMQERAQLLCGTFDIRSVPGKGTTVSVEVPDQIT